MASYSSLGIGTGVDLQSMLTKIMAAERIPINTLDTRISDTNSKISVYGTLKSKLDALKSAAETLQYPSRLSAIAATSSDTTVMTSSAAFNAPIGSYSMAVTQLASAQKSFSVAYSAGTTFGPGALNFTVAGQAATTVELADDPVGHPDGYTLQEVGASINNAKIGVTATVITTSSGEQRMVLTGDKSGDGNGFSLTSTMTPSGGQASLDSFDTLTPGLNRASATNALMTIDGIEVSSSTNVFSPTGTGLTLTALKLGTSEITVQNSSDTITKAAQAFVDAFNAVATTVKSNSGFNAATKTGQAFAGDMAARTVLDTLGNARSSMPPELSDATFKTLASLGITIQRTGLLSLDTSKLNSAISNSPGEAVKTLNAYGAAFNSAITNMLGTNGTVANRINSLNAAVTRLTENKDAMEIRVGLIEKRYRAQFTALDKLVSSMQTVSASLGQQLATLPTGSSN